MAASPEIYNDQPDCQQTPDTGLIDVRYDGLRVTLHVFSGTRDPTWRFERGDAAFYSLERQLQGHGSTDLAPVLGYSGFSVEWLRGQSSYAMTIGKCSDPGLELFLLEHVEHRKPDGQDGLLSDTVVKYVREQIQKCPPQTVG